MYLIVVAVAFLLGGVFAAGVRIELTIPQGDFVSADTYNKLFTMHGVTMVFFVLIQAVPAILGNFALPLMIGAKDVAFPKINQIFFPCTFGLTGLHALHMVVGFTLLAVLLSDDPVPPDAVGLPVARLVRGARRDGGRRNAAYDRAVGAAGGRANRDCRRGAGPLIVIGSGPM